METHLEPLRRVLERLASPANEQIEYLRNMQVHDADELALELDDVLRSPLREVLSEEINRTLDSLDAYLDTISGSDNESLWSFEALENRPEWQEVRQRAHAALAMLS